MEEFTFYVKDRKISYEVPIKNKFTVISGLSGSGKSTLFNLVNRAANNVYGTEVTSPLPVLALGNNFDIINLTLQNIKEHLIVMDEDADILNPKGIQDMKRYGNMLQSSQNIFILITRNILPIPLPHYSYLEVVRKKKSNHIAVPFNLKLSQVNILNPNYYTIIEDEGAAFVFLKDFLHIDEMISTKGISKFTNIVEKCITQNYRYLNLVFDTLGSGFYTKQLLNVLNSYPGVIFNIIDWKSFEYYILQSKNFKDSFYQCKDIYCNNVEDFYTKELSNYINYSKGNIENTCLDLNQHCRACNKYQSCAFSVENRKDNYLHEPLITGGISNKSKTNFFSN